MFEPAAEFMHNSVSQINICTLMCYAPGSSCMAELRMAKDGDTTLMATG